MFGDFKHSYEKHSVWLYSLSNVIEYSSGKSQMLWSFVIYKTIYNLDSTRVPYLFNIEKQ